jgi:hypothetical protein
MTPETLQGWLQVGVSGLLLVALFLGGRKLWVFGWQFADMAKQYEERIAALERDRDEWKKLAMHNLQLTAKLTEVGERIVERTGE